jgi:hypothetical protein
MAKAAVRGTKRWCQGEVCALPFYDLNRAAFCCPNCGAAYDLRLARSLAVSSQPTVARFAPLGPALGPKPEPEAEPAQSPDEEEDEGETGDAGDAETLIEDDDEEIDVTGPKSCRG